MFTNLFNLSKNTVAAGAAIVKAADVGAGAINSYIPEKYAASSVGFSAASDNMANDAVTAVSDWVSSEKESVPSSHNSMFTAAK